MQSLRISAPPAGAHGDQKLAASANLGIEKEIYEVGDRVWYLMRDGSREAAKVDSVDRTVQPFSYGVILSTMGSVRETEALRLRGMTAAEESAAEAELAKLPAEEGEHCCASVGFKTGAQPVSKYSFVVCPCCLVILTLKGF